jgi:hypothetical protein
MPQAAASAASAIDMENEPRRRNRYFIKAMMGIQAITGVVRMIIDILAMSM